MTTSVNISAPGTPKYEDQGTYLTQGKLPTSPDTKTIDIYQYTLFAQDSVKRLTASDFTLNSKELIALVHTDCILALFYTENKESLELCKIWGIVAQQVPGPVFAACNLIVDRKVADAFTKLKSDGNHSLNWAGIKGLPFILVYRQGWPVAFYNGDRSVQSLVDYSLTLACKANYYETQELSGGMQAQAQIQMTGIQGYGTGQRIEEKTKSTDFKTTNPIRGYNTSLGLARTGTQEQEQASQAIQQELANVQGQTGQSVTSESEVPSSNQELPAPSSTETTQSSTQELPAPSNTVV